MAAPITHIALTEKIFDKFFINKIRNERVIVDFTRGIGFSKEAAQEINENIALMRTNKKIIKIIKNLYKNFELLIT